MVSGLKSAISIMGGKSYLSKWLCSFIPEHITYVEPFCGGAKLLFVKEHSPVEILNDIDNNLVNLYRIIQNDERT
jgi:DNA adenine methylase